MPHLARLQWLGAVAVIAGARGRDRGAARREGGGADRALAGFSARPEGPVTVVFGTFGYRRVVRAWMDCAERAGVRHYRIVCMDEPLLRALREECGERRAVAYRDVVPGTGGADIDALPDAAARLRVLTPMRMALFRRLADAGHDFVHSDADAFWQRDLRPWLAGHGGYDLLFSQGTTHPVAHFKAHHFTLCAGCFLARATPATRAFLAAAEVAGERARSDQAGIGLALLDRACRWRIERPEVALRTAPRGAGADPRRHPWFRARLGAAGGALLGRALAAPGTARAAHVALRLAGLHAMVTSRTVMRGICADGLRIGVIPMHVVERVPLGAGATAHVSHVSANKRAAVPAEVGDPVGAGR